jgi:hypothetical protein
LSFLAPPAYPAGLDSELDSRSLTSLIAATQDPDQLYNLALSALAADQSDLARQTLERVVTSRPRFAGAWLDLALATYRSGDAAAALEHLEYLRSQFTLPPALAAQVDYWYLLWQLPQDPAPATWARGWHGQVLLGYGYDSNANAGLASDQITLNLPSGSVIFDVDSAYLPRADWFGLLGVNATGATMALGGGRLTPVFYLRSKQLVHETDFSSIDVQPGLMFQLPVAGDGLWQYNLYAQHYSLGGQALFNGLRLSTQRSQAWNTCYWSVGAEVEDRYHQRVPNLGGTLLSLNAGLGCRLPASAYLGGTFRAGYERTRFDRAGGDNQGTELTVFYDHPLNDSQSLQANLQLSQLGDREGYSPLMEDNAPRRIQRLALALGMRQAINHEWEARLSYIYFQQRANLPLFRQQGSLLMLGIAYQFN